MTRQVSVRLVIVGCLLAYGVLIQQSRYADLDRHARAEEVSPLRDAEIKQLQKRLSRFEQELQVLNRKNVFPGLLSVEKEPSPKTLAPLRELVEARLAMWRRTRALYEANRAGGEAECEARARTELHLGLAQLAWIERREEEARARLQDAIAAATQWVTAVQAEYDAGATSLDAVLEAVTQRAELKMTLLRAGGELESTPDLSEPWQLPPGRMPGSLRSISK